jgi:carbonic anhydrase
MESLLEGYRRFRRATYPSHSDTYRTLAADGQSPRAMVIGCCDSRVDPAAIFDAGPGELFVVRNVANLVPPFATDAGHHGTSAAIEFAVGTLGVQHILVMGHASCGGIRALMGGVGRTGGGGSHIERWMSIAVPALETTLQAGHEAGTDACAAALEQAAIGHSLGNLEGFPSVREAVAAGRLQLHGAWFDIETGALHLRDSGDGTFRLVAVPEA